MRFLSAQTSGWGSLDEPDGDAAGALKRMLTAVLLAERLVLLTGLGTSRCLVGADGNPVAPTMPDLWKGAKDIAGAAFDEILEKVGWAEGARDDIEMLLSRCQMALELERDKKLEDFVGKAEAMIVSACRFVTAELDLSVHEAFLRRVARRSTRLPRTQLFTTNYDLAFETAAARSGFAVIDGFSHSYPQRFDGTYFEQDFATRDRERAAVPVEWVPNVVQLHKLHGSVDWAADPNGEVRRDAREAKPLIIYPRSSKYEVSYQQPFLELMARFQASLRRPETGLLILGSGFNDDHITQPIMAALRANVRLSAVVVSPSLHESGNPSLKRMASLIQQGDRRLGLFAGTFEEAVHLLPDLVAESETERHEARLASGPDG
jgi:hypothetical protein